jgi:osmotically inducible lipoprotein OsmB
MIKSSLFVNKTFSLLIIGSLTLGITGCGNSQMDRALSGAGIGAGAGAVTGALVGGSVGGAMIVGAGAGAIVGAVSDNSKINLGKPIWRK